MNDILTTSSYFGLALTLIMFAISSVTVRKLKVSFLSPIIVASAIIIILLLVLDIEYETYETGASWISLMLTPATICYAVPLYRQIQILRKNLVAILVSIFCGCLASLGCVYLFSRLFGFTADIYAALLPKSVTTAIGMGLSEELGGIVPITITAIMITGIFGGAAAVAICRIFHIKNSVAKGLAIGTSSHAVGTSRAIEIGDVEGAMSGLAIVIAGLMTVVLAPLASNLIH